MHNDFMNMKGVMFRGYC